LVDISKWGPGSLQIEPYVIRDPEKEQERETDIKRARRVKPPENKNLNRAGEDITTGLNSEKMTRNEGA
jgi:hypothetical protein